ncbi:MAG: 23S rRNA (adenine(2503)-C(2))-methyltransferase RlmN [Acidobacteriia bacterium]|nr:23S rRNA (adenine(2503)-C(2))-methyltransferase RlmN [Terriglobia bacterium]
MQIRARRNLVGASRAELAELLAELDPHPFRAEQVYQWLSRRMAGDVDEMTNLPKALRQALAERAVVQDPEVIEVRRGNDGTAKFALSLADRVVIEAVAMPMEGHTTICLSSQTGCAVGCIFCVTGVLGAGRNLTGGEIFGQYRAILRREGLVGAPVNVVFMGMGEPLLNLPNVARAVELIAETVSPRRVTVSTSGIVPGIRKLAALERRPKLAVSLNATTQEQRERLMPIAAHWPLAELLDTLRSFPLERGRRITFEYVMLAGINDSDEDARRLPRLLRGIPAKVNLIPLNPDQRYLGELEAPDEQRISEFAGILAAAHVNVTVRWSKGREVAAACGQLRGQLTIRPPA